MIFKVVKTTAIRVPNLRAAIVTMVTINTAITATSLIAHWGMASGDASGTV